MYSRNTDRGGRRIKLPPGYDGSAFRHDTGEVRRYGGDTEMKIHSPGVSENNTEAVEERLDDAVLGPLQGHVGKAGENRRGLSGMRREMQEEKETWPEGYAADRGGHEADTADRAGREKDAADRTGHETSGDAADRGICEREKDPAEGAGHDIGTGQSRENCVIPVQTGAVEGSGSGKGSGALLEGLLGSLGSEDWLLFLVILLLVADGSDAWDLILLLGVLLAVK